MEPTMFTSTASRTAAYRNASVDTLVHNATPHQLICMLFDGFLQSVRAAQGAMERAEVATKGQQLGQAVRILEEGLKGSLDMQKGGEVALNLRALYDYCVRRLTDANVKNDVAALAEVSRLIEPVADGWRQMGAATSATSANAPLATAAAIETSPLPGLARMLTQRVPSVSAYAPGI
jgi:flagellar protein FliS